MQGVQSGKKIKERTAGVRRKVNSLMAEGVPHEQLAGQKTETKQYGQTQPGQVSLQFWRSNSERCELSFSQQTSASEFQGNAAQHEHKCVDEQKAVGKCQGMPIGSALAHLGVPAIAPYAPNVDHSQTGKERAYRHDARDHPY